jgi:hypothetical protein
MIDIVAGAERHFGVVAVNTGGAGVGQMFNIVVAACPVK